MRRDPEGRVHDVHGGVGRLRLVAVRVVRALADLGVIATGDRGVALLHVMRRDPEGCVHGVRVGVRVGFMTSKGRGRVHDVQGEGIACMAELSLHDYYRRLADWYK